MDRGHTSSELRALLGLVDGNSDRIPSTRQPVGGFSEANLRAIENAVAPANEAIIYRPSLCSLEIGARGMRSTVRIGDQE